MNASDTLPLTAEIDPKDRREHTRKTTIYSGRLSAGVNEAACEVLNISSGGAQLRVPDAKRFEGIVTLRIDRFGGFHVRVVWAGGDRLGVQFLEDPRRIAERIAITA